MGLFFVFPRVFTKPKQLSGKPKIPKKTKENQNTLGKTKNKVFKGFRPTLGYGFLFIVLVFPKVFTKQQNIRENQKYKRKPKKTKQIFCKTKKQVFLRFKIHPWI